MSEFIKAQHELRANLTMQIRDVIDSAEAEGRGLDAAELEKIDRIEADIRKADQSIEVAARAEERKVEASVAAKGFIPAVSEERGAADILRGIALGEIRGGHEFTKRAALVPTNNTVPKDFYSEVFDVARLNGPMLETSEVINTESGADLTIPTLTAYSTATLTAAGSAIGASEPTYSSITLGAKKYAFLIQAAAELVQDSGFDLASHLARQAGNAIGQAVNSALTNGTGTTVPTGIVTAASSGVTGGTGVAGAFTADALIDLAYSVDGAVRRLPGAAFMANGQTIGAMRKLKDTAGNYLYQVGVGYPDTFAGFRVVENPHVPAIATSAKSVLFGDLSSYKVRVAGGIQVASSMDYAFNQDLMTWRFLIRLDGALTHSAHVKTFQGAAS
jgi:HK97 family phage major capsid protein